LGIVFYELLAGERPFDLEGKTLDQIIRVSAESAPRLPSQALKSNPQSVLRSARLEGDLDNIALMSVNYEISRRYKSVDQFADDIDRHLKALPVSARPNTYRYRAAKFLKRHKVGALAAGLIGLTVIAGVAATLRQ